MDVSAEGERRREEKDKGVIRSQQLLQTPFFNCPCTEFPVCLQRLRGKKDRVDKTRCFTAKHFQTSTGHQEGAAQLLVRLQMLCLGTGVPWEPAGCEQSARCLPLLSMGDAPYRGLVPPNGVRSVSGAGLGTRGGKEGRVRSRWKTPRSSALCSGLQAGRSSDGRGRDKKCGGLAVLLLCGQPSRHFVGGFAITGDPPQTCAVAAR